MPSGVMWGWGRRERFDGDCEPFCSGFERYAEWVDEVVSTVIGSLEVSAVNTGHPQTS